jgi:anti-sigma regulatory factor (Ser/Thr protein kinase)
MSKADEGLKMTLPASAENVAVVRHALAGLAETLGMDEQGIADLKTVVTEACMNVVVHAYDEEPGPLEVDAHMNGRGVKVVVRDYGRGIQPRAEPERPSLRLGLSLIAALSESFEISGGLDQGTRIAMLVPLTARAGTAERAADTADAPGDATTLTVGAAELVGPILARVVGALAARSDVTIDRLSDAMLLTDAISADAPAAFADGKVRIDLRDGDGGIDLRVGPLENGAGERLREGLEVPSVGSLEKLADELSVEQNGRGEYLRVRFAAAD